ncbi:MAG: prolyl aminopeptidase [Alphaproteobacteria bacterium]
MRDWYPERKPYATHRLKVSSLHELHIEECGNPKGEAVIWLHGGPGSGLYRNHGRQFDPEFYRIILFDQRGSGQSTPYADVRENTTRDLIADIEKIREYFGISRWLVAGRSWGATLALLYAQAHPERVTALFLAAIFLCDTQSIRWLFQDGASRIYSQAWEEYVALVPPEKRGDIMKAYGDMLLGENQEIALKAARAWSIWEGHTCSVLPDPGFVADFAADNAVLSLARLEHHYLSRGGFVEEGHILKNAHKIAHIPVKIVHGRYDMNCTYDNAWKLHQALPKSELITIPLGGHATNDPATVDAQIRAADALKAMAG